MSRQYHLFGSLEILVDGQPSELLNSPKGCALVTYLIVTGQTHPREFLADMFWEATSTAQALQNLRSLLTRIRDLVPDIQITRRTVAFQPLPDTQVDFLALQSVLSINPEQADILQLDAALHCYRGDLLENFYLDEVPRFEEWLVLERERLHQQVRAVYNRLCKHYLTHEQWSRGNMVAERWLKLEPLDEEALRAAMHFLASSGSPGKGLERFEGFRQQLWDDMGLEPEPATLSLAARLETLREEQGQQLTWDHVSPTNLPEPGVLADPGPLPTQSVIPHPRNHDFTGRKESLLHLASLLMPSSKTGAQRATVITGMGGVGKTQLAVEFCYRYGRFFPGGVYWLNFADSDHVADEVAQIGGERGMGLYRETDNLHQADQVGRVRKAWQDPVPRLLIFDSCEEEELLTQWIPVTGGCSVLLTSRRAYWTRELQAAEWPLPMLDVDESVSLLQNLTPNLPMDDATRIAEELGYLPLALHLAGSFLRKYKGVPAEQYLVQLRGKNLLTHPSLQGRGTHFSPTGHELDVARTFAINWDQLEPSDKTDAFALQLITHAVQFAPGVPIPRELLFATIQIEEEDWAQVLLAEDGLARLIALGFISLDRGSTLWLHRLIAAFVTMRIQDVPEAQTAVAHAVWQQLKTQWDTDGILDQLGVAPAHVGFILEKEMARGTPEAVSLTHAWGRHLYDIGEHVRARQYLEKALELSKQRLGDNAPETAEILTTFGMLVRDYVSVQEAWPYSQQAFAIFEKVFGLDHIKTGDSLMNLAILHARAGDYDEAIAKYEQTLLIYGRVLPPVHPEVTRTLYNLAVVYRRLGKYPTALSYFEDSLRIREQIWPAEHPMILIALSSIAITHNLMGNYEAAYGLHQKVLKAREMRMGYHHPATATSLGNLGVTLGYLGKYQEAITYLQESLVIRENIYGMEHSRLVFTLTHLGFLFQAVGELDTAQQVLERGKGIHESKHLENERTAEILTNLASVLMERGEMEASLQYLQKAKSVFEKHPEQSQAAKTFICLGEWWEAQGDMTTAKTQYEKAWVILSGNVVETHHDWIRVQAHLARIKKGD